MIYLSLALNAALVALLIAQRWEHGRQVEKDRAYYNQREDNFYEQLRGTLKHNRELTNQVVLQRLDPPTAVAQAAAGIELEELFIPPLDDKALADYEAER